jgi:hypothetical protein
MHRARIFSIFSERKAKGFDASPETLNLKLIKERGHLNTLRANDHRFMLFVGKEDYRRVDYSWSWGLD